MTTQEIVRPSEIEQTLTTIWEKLAKTNKTRACLFNLIVFTKLDVQSDYMRLLVQKVVEKYPCRILFISHDALKDKDYLKTAVSIVTSPEEDSHVACDSIDIGVAGKELEKVPFLILPHLIPDLPVYLLWTDDICEENPIFNELSKFATKVIFDSEKSDQFSQFAANVEQAHFQKKLTVADLNWARMEAWRNLFTSQFYSQERIEMLQTVKSISITYNCKETEYFCHSKIQSLYLQAWISSRMGFTFQKLTNEKKQSTLSYKTNHGEVDFHLIPKETKDLTPGSIISIQITTENKEINLTRDENQLERVIIHISSKESCWLPYTFMLGKNLALHSLANEIIHRGTSKHYLETLEILKKMESL